MGIFQRRRGNFAATLDWQLWIFKNWKFHHFLKWISGMVSAKKTTTTATTKITSSNAHRVLICQKNFRTLTENLFVKVKKCSNISQEFFSQRNQYRDSAITLLACSLNRRIYYWWKWHSYIWVNWNLMRFFQT